MFANLIVPLDGSRLSEKVLPVVAHLAEKMRASVTLVHVIERNAPRQIHGEQHLSNPTEAEVYLQKIKAEAFPAGARVETHVHTTAITNVARSIVEHAKEFRSDLVMMCIHGRAGLRGFLFGSIADQVVSSGVPVLLVRATENKDGPVLTGGPVLVPLDGTETREQAIPAAAELATACGTGLHLLMVVPTFATLSGETNTSRFMLPATTLEMLDLMQEDAAVYLSGLTSSLAAEGLAVTTGVVRGDPSELIEQEAQRLGTDFLVLGTAGKSGLDAFWSSSLAPKISSRTRRPLLLVPSRP